MRRSRLLTLVIGLGLMVAACASPVGAPAAQSEAPAEGQAGDSEGGEGGSTGEAPVLADGPWTSGQGQVTVSGSVDWATDEPITTDVSHTTDSKTQLAYNSDDTYVTIGFNFIGVPFHASVTAPHFNASGEDCDVTYARADDSGVEGTFSCTIGEFHALSADVDNNGTGMIEGSFSASR